MSVEARLCQQCYKPHTVNNRNEAFQRSVGLAAENPPGVCTVLPGSVDLIDDAGSYQQGDVLTGQQYLTSIKLPLRLNDVEGTERLRRSLSSRGSSAVLEEDLAAREAVRRIIVRGAGANNTADARSLVRSAQVGQPHEDADNSARRILR